ncbi:MAG TPA: hypothetical protein VKH81_02800 [Candidatus Angelobacter sp.]|nr:hypothetical protein [Candidatus Angelobacter sp.]
MKACAPRTRYSKLRTCVLLAILASASAVWAQFTAPTLPPAPVPLPAYQSIPPGFDIVGYIEFASADAFCLANSNPTPDNPPQPDGCKTAGGWLRINNQTIRVPANSIVEFPANTLTWEELFEFNSTHVSGETGMALADTVRLPGTFEAHVQGNIVNGQMISGLIFVAQETAMGQSGFIQGFDFKNGIVIVNNTRVQINDPLGKFSAGYASWDPIYLQDQRFSIDENNPTIRTETAFPVCVPRSDPATGDDPLCPKKNRPKNATGLDFLRIFTMDPVIDPATNAPPVAFNGDLTQPPTDPTVFAPLEVGDFITYSGEVFLDSQGAPYVLAHTITANLGIFTTPGTDPAYIAIDVLLQGTGGVGNPVFPQEAGVRTRVEGFSTDPSRGIDVYAIDIDCNGVPSQRIPFWAANFPVDPGPPAGAVKGRWRFRPAGGNFMPPSMVIGAEISGGLKAVANPTLNILTDQYQAPNFDFIFAENLGVGNPPVTFNFRDLPFLVNGIGPWPPADNIVQGAASNPNGFTKQVIGQLNPFPDNNSPATACVSTVGTNNAKAVASFSPGPGPITTGTLVTLSSAGSTPTNGPFSWQQVVNPGDPFVTITNANSATATFSAPVVASPTTLTFQLTVGGNNTSNPATANLLVPIAQASPTTPPAVTAISSPANNVSSGAVVTLTSTAIDPAGGPVTFAWTAPAGIVLTSGAADGSVQSFTAPIVPTLSGPQSFVFTVKGTSAVSGLSGTGTLTVIVNPQADRVIITAVTYRAGKARLTITATDLTPGVSLTATLDIINQATGQPWTGVMGPAVPPAPGTFSIVFSNVGPPNVVTVTSSGGGSATSGITVLRP